MSRTCTSWAWWLDIKPATLKLVVLALADRADNDGYECYPSIGRVAKDTGLNKKTVQQHIAKLITLGYVSDTGKRVGKMNRVRVLKIHPKGNVPEIGNDTENGLINDTEIGAINVPEIGIQNQSLEPVSNNQSDIYSNLDFSTWPDKPSEEVLTEWLSLRKRKKAKVTPIVLKAMGKELTLSSQKGYTVDQCLTECVLNNWQGFKASWVKDATPDNPIDYSDIPIDSIVKLYNDILSSKTSYRVSVVSDQLKRDIAKRCRNSQNASNSQWWAQFFSACANRLNHIEPQFRPARYKLDRMVGRDFEEVLNEVNSN